MVELLLSKGADVNYLSDCGTPLHIAAMENQGAVMKILLEYNADVRFKQDKHISSFHELVQLPMSLTNIVSSLFMKELLVTFCQQFVSTMDMF